MAQPRPSKATAATWSSSNETHTSTLSPQIGLSPPAHVQVVLSI